jgi:hypothetical protein
MAAILSQEGESTGQVLFDQRNRSEAEKQASGCGIPTVSNHSLDPGADEPIIFAKVISVLTERARLSP